MWVTGSQSLRLSLLLLRASLGGVRRRPSAAPKTRFSMIPFAGLHACFLFLACLLPHVLLPLPFIDVILPILCTDLIYFLSVLFF